MDQLAHDEPLRRSKHLSSAYTERFNGLLHAMNSVYRLVAMSLPIEAKRSAELWIPRNRCQNCLHGDEDLDSSPLPALLLPSSHPKNRRILVDLGRLGIQRPILHRIDAFRRPAMCRSQSTFWIYLRQ